MDIPGQTEETVRARRFDVSTASNGRDDKPLENGQV